MKIKSISYIREQDRPNAWVLKGDPNSDSPLYLNDINLIIGQNASGKSNTIEAIRNLADLLCGDQTLRNIDRKTASYNVVFENGQKHYNYILSYVEGEVTDERLFIDNVLRLDRSRGKMYYEKLKQDVDFKTDPSVLAATRRDSEQQSYLEDLYQWGRSTCAYYFGTHMGRNLLIRDIQSLLKETSFNPRETDKVSGLFAWAMHTTPSIKQKVISDMERVGYHIEDISASLLKHFSVSAYGLSAKERGLNEATEQLEMSQGMFRALSLLIQLNYSLESNTPSCILIDDIGEGLDFERSKELITLIMEKTIDSSIQVVMSSNDRYVMNIVPLEYWHVIWRSDNTSTLYNYRNSKKIFDDYRYLGLNNFEFFSTRFFKDGMSELDDSLEEDDDDEEGEEAQ